MMLNHAHGVQVLSFLAASLPVRVGSKSQWLQLLLPQLLHPSLSLSRKQKKISLPLSLLSWIKRKIYHLPKWHMLPHWRTPDKKSSTRLPLSPPGFKYGPSFIYLYRKRRTIELLRASFMYTDSCCHTYRTTGDMENGGNTYGHSHSYTSDSFSTDRGHYRNITVAAAHPASWDAVGGGGGGSGSGSYFTSLPRFDWTNNLSSAAYAPTVNDHGGSALPADPHLTCLQLGKRHCFEFGGGVVASSAFSDGGRRGRRGYCSGGVMGTVRCQVEGCEAALGSAKEYHRRHRVCEVHAKAPVVVVMGRHQRFCQQCSRFIFYYSLLLRLI